MILSKLVIAVHTNHADDLLDLAGDGLGHGVLDQHYDDESAEAFLGRGCDVERLDVDFAAQKHRRNAVENPRVVLGEDRKNVLLCLIGFHSARITFPG